MANSKYLHKAPNGQLFTIKAPYSTGDFHVFIGKGTGTVKGIFPTLEQARQFCDAWMTLIWKPICANDGRVGGAYFLPGNTMFAPDLHPFTAIGYSFR